MSLYNIMNVRQGRTRRGVISMPLYNIMNVRQEEHVVELFQCLYIIL